MYVAGRNHLIDPENHERNLRTIVQSLEEVVTESGKTSDGYMALIIDQEGTYGVSCELWERNLWSKNSLSVRHVKFQVLEGRTWIRTCSSVSLASCKFFR